MPAYEQERRQAAVDEMYKQGTVQWTTSELLTYTTNGNKKSTHSNIYIPGVTYYGIPYNGVGGGYVRAMSIMQPEKDDQGRFVTKTGLQMACGEGIIEIRTLQAEGGKRMAAPDYFRGHPLEL